MTSSRRDISRSSAAETGAGSQATFFAAGIRSGTSERIRREKVRGGKNWGFKSRSSTDGRRRIDMAVYDYQLHRPARGDGDETGRKEKG